MSEPTADRDADLRLDALPDTPAGLVRAYLDAADHGRARKRFGQHFLVADNVLDGIVAGAGVGEGTRVLEVGPGPGVLTAALLRAGACVTAVELDRDCVAHLRRTFPVQEVEAPPTPGRLRLFQADATTVDLDLVLGDEGGQVQASNLPYNVGTRILLRLLDDPRLDRHVLMLQHEVAERILAGVGDRKRGSLSAAVQARAAVDRVMRVPPGAFRPPPKVDSAVVRLRARHAALPAGLDDLLKAAFRAPRKTVRNNLKHRFGADVEAHLAAAGIDPRARPAAVETDAWVRLAAAGDSPPAT